MRVSLFVPCFVDQFAPAVAWATVRLLRRCGVEVDFDPRQTCCGQPAFNSGYAAEAASVARHFLDVFQRCDTIVAPSGSCVAMIRRHFPQLLDDPAGVGRRVHELCEFLVGRLGRTNVGARWRGRAALHLPCHLLRELDAGDAVRALLAAVEGLELVDLPSDTWCCGFGGTFSIRYPELSAAMAETKLRQVADAGIEWVLSPESSCLMQLEGVARRLGLSLRMMHVAEVLAGPP